MEYGNRHDFPIVHLFRVLKVCEFLPRQHNKALACLVSCRQARMPAFFTITSKIKRFYHNENGYFL
jgi:hypothetical protein